jgi:uncharacterized membrane protein YgcG
MIGKAMLGRRRRAQDPDIESQTHTQGLHRAETVTTVLDPMELLSTPLSDGDLTVALARRPKLQLPSLTLTLAMVVVAGLGCLGGIFLGEHFGGSTSPAASAFSRFAAAAGASPSASTGGTSSTGFAGRGGGLFGGSGGATLGTVKLVDGNIVYVQTAAGDIVQVSTSSATKVTISSSAPVKDLTPGETVIVEGNKNANGSIAATSISQSSFGGGGGSGGGAVGTGG